MGPLASSGEVESKTFFVGQNDPIHFNSKKPPRTYKSYESGLASVLPDYWDSPGNESAIQSLDKSASELRARYGWGTEVKYSGRIKALDGLLGLQISGSNEEAKLGSGYNATVYLANDKSTGNKYAVKIISSDSGDRFLQPDNGEYLGLSLLPHKGIASICALIVHNTVDKTYAAIKGPQSILSENCQDYRIRCVISEYIEGEDLFDTLNGYWSILEKTDLAIQVALQGSAALGHYHQHDILYRDMKPENIMISPGREGSQVDVKLVDAGTIIRLSDAKNVDATIVGTKEYMAPEVIDVYCNQKMDSICDVGVDLWGLGVTLIAVVTDHDLFQLVKQYYKDIKKPIDESLRKEWDKKAEWNKEFAKMNDKTKREILNKNLGLLLNNPSFVRKYNPLVNVIIGLTKSSPEDRMALADVQKTLAPILTPASLQEDIRNQSQVIYV
ncbi:protein kinase domain-containing protein [Endozoicomonas sp.]|uniref:protein kinase domain-containing protein n=1 Tax=Endozoicomonas sp. TaxID=1892382 RepID=UPI002887DB9C|nr:protein kinase [Endozoicomonas sp.]